MLPTRPLPHRPCLTLTLLFASCTASSTGTPTDPSEASQTGTLDETEGSSNDASSSEGTSGASSLEPENSACGRYLVRPVAGASCNDVAERSEDVVTFPIGDGDPRLCLVDGPIKNLDKIEEFAEDCPVVHPAGTECKALTGTSLDRAAGMMKAACEDHPTCETSNVVVYVMDGVDRHDEVDCMASECAVSHPHAQDVITITAATLGPEAPCTTLRVRRAMGPTGGTIGEWLLAHQKVLDSVRVERQDPDPGRHYVIVEPLGWLTYGEHKKSFKELEVVKVLAALAAEGVWVAAATGNRGMDSCTGDTDVAYPALYADPTVLGESSPVPRSIVVCGAVGLDERLSSTTRFGAVVPVLAPGELHQDSNGRCGAIIGSSLAAGACGGALARAYRAAVSKPGPEPELSIVVEELWAHGIPVRSDEPGMTVTADRGEHGIPPGAEARIINIGDTVESLSAGELECTDKNVSLDDFRSAYLNALKAPVAYRGGKANFASKSCLWFDVEPTKPLPVPKSMDGEDCSEDWVPGLTSPVTPSPTCGKCTGGTKGGKLQVILAPDLSELSPGATCALECMNGEQTFVEPLNIERLGEQPKLLQFDVPEAVNSLVCDFVCKWNHDGDKIISRVPINLVDGAILSSEDLALPECEFFGPGLDPAAECRQTMVVASCPDSVQRGSTPWARIPTIPSSTQPRPPSFIRMHETDARQDVPSVPGTSF
jgi:hypothetical protein